MPRDGSGVYSIPTGTHGVPDTTISSARYNAYVDDVAQDLNTPRPIVAGGTGATNATDALNNLGGELAEQVITNYDSDPFQAGSFYSATTATNPPVAGHGFAGICYQSDADNMVIEARDQNDTLVPGRVYIRQMQAAVWGPWSPSSSGSISVSDTAPANVPDGSLWWESDTGNLYILYNDGTSTQWVLAVPSPGLTFVQKAGDTMGGPLTLAGPPTAALHAATKQYVDSSAAPSVHAVYVTTFTASGTYTPNPNLIYATVEAIGGGGAGGSVTAGSASASAGGTGGGAGGFVRQTTKFTGPQTVSIGAAGAAAAAGANAGGSGGTTSFGTLTATGGAGGPGGTATAGGAGKGAAGGQGSGGDLNVRGEPGGGTLIINTSFGVQGGAGGSGPYGGGGPSQSSGAGNAAQGFGAGGGGAAAFTTSGPFAGGAGAPGAVIITEYCSV
jgi:hypothetical protein